VLYSYRSTIGLIDKLTELLKNNELKIQHELAKNNLQKNKIDPTAFLVWFLENYPNSKSIMQQDLTFQDKFIN
jgi:hypothetical protein